MEFETDRTPTEALKFLLESRLRFGDALQIDALLILELAERLIGSDQECPMCLGTGDHQGDGKCGNCGQRCIFCETDTCGTCKGLGTVERSRDEVYRMRSTEIYKLLNPANAIPAALRSSPEATAQ